MAMVYGRDVMHTSTSESGDGILNPVVRARAFCSRSQMPSHPSDSWKLMATSMSNRESNHVMMESPTHTRHRW